MASNTKLYTLLNVPPTATDAEIKKSYRKLAKEFHPDKNPAAGDKFKEISGAYEILSDPRKKEIYDRYGMSALQDEGGPGDLFSQLLGGFFGGRRGPRKAEDTVHPLKVTLEDLYNGKTSKLQVERCVTCSTCSGKGSMSGATRPCRSCEGKGYKAVYSPLGPRMVQEVRMHCDSCNGEKQVIPEKDKCQGCNGKKLANEAKILEVFVEKGMRGGEKITFKGEGDQVYYDAPGDVIIILQEQPHPKFKREGCDLFMMLEISLTEALCGFSFTIKHLDGRNLVVNSPPGKVISPDAVMGLEDEGMPQRKNPCEHGNLYIKFNVVFPPNHFRDEATLTLLESLLPARPVTDDKMEGENVEEVDMHEYEEMKSSNHSAGAEYDEDDDQPPIHMEYGNIPGCKHQ